MSNFIANRLVLQNFKKHKNLEVVFSEGITAIRGPNYSGKSSIIEGIFYALIGVYAVPGGKAVVLNRSPEAKACSVTLDFTSDDISGSITRTPTTASVTMGGLVVATGHTSVNDWVEVFFGMPQKLILTLSRSSQGETSALMTLGAAELNRIIESVANSKYVDDLAARANKQATQASSQLAFIGELPDIEALLNSKKETESNLECIIEKQQLAKGATEFFLEAKNLATHILNTTLASNCKIKKEKEEKEVRDVEKRDIQTNLTYLNQSLVDLQSKIVDVSELARAIDAYGILETEADEAVTKHKDLSINLGYLYKQLGYLHEQKEKEPNQKLFDEKSAILAELLKSATNLYNNLVEAKKAVIKYEKEVASAVCSSCNRPFDQFHLDSAKINLAKFTGVVTEAQKLFSSEQAKYGAVKAEIEALKKLLPETGWEGRLTKVEADIEEVTSFLASMPSIEELQLKARTAYQRKAALEADYKASVAASKQFLLISEKVESLNVRMQKLATMDEGYVEKQEVDITPLIAKKDATSSKYEEASAEYKDLTNALVSLEAELANLSNKIEDARMLKAKKLGLEAREARFSGFSKWLLKNKTTFLNDIWEGILSGCSEFSSSCTDGAITQVIRDESGGFSYVEDGTTYPMEAASGGQKAIMGVGLRLALASLLPQGCRLVALDEPTSDLNDLHAAMLTSALKGQGRQVVMTTHRDGDEIVADETITLGE